MFSKKKNKQITPLNAPNKLASNKIITISSRDIAAISGDNELDTQIDLARAYLETGKKQLAKKILDYVSNNGNKDQKNAAEHLLESISSCASHSA